VTRLDTFGKTPSRTFHTYKWGTGPYLEGLFSQSNLGIVVSAGMWLMPEPQEHNYFLLELHEEKNFAAMVDQFRKLSLNRILSNVHIFNPYMVTFGYEQFPLDLPSEVQLPQERLNEIIKKWGIHPWTGLGAFYGTKAQVAASRHELQQAISRLGRLHILNPKQLRLITKIRKWAQKPWQLKLLDVGSKLFLGKSYEQVKFLPELFTYQRGEPAEFLISRAYYKNRRIQKNENINPAQDHCGIFWLAPIIPAIGSEIEVFLNKLRDIFAKHSSEPCLSLIQVNPRTFIAAIFIVYDKDSVEDTAKAKKLYQFLASEVQKMGYQHYRTSVIYMDQIIHPDSGNAGIGRKLKEALDPLKILAPGRYGP
jgi:4-cresol dehydrogenase (hydroxylating) flavoprotein subunit